jgi:hypothetical protein
MNSIKEDIRQWMKSQPGASESVGRISDSFFTYQLNRITQPIGSLQNKESLNVLFFTHRPEYFDQKGLHVDSSTMIGSVTFCHDRQSLLSLDGTFDVAIVCTHIRDEFLAQLIIRARDLAAVIVAWAWDNHHHDFQNLCACSLADIVIPAHRFCANKLKAPSYVLADAVPLCTAQWSRESARKYLDATLHLKRKNALSGGYILWEPSDRNSRLLKLRETVPGNELNLIAENERSEYFLLTARERFLTWGSYKTSLQVPYSGDVSLRIFDALIAGQIPIVPGECHDLDSIIPPAVQQTLPILRLEDLSVSSVISATEEAVETFDRMGQEGVLARHTFASEHHHISSRIEFIVAYISELSRSLNVHVRIDADGIGLVAMSSDLD